MYSSPPPAQPQTYARPNANGFVPSQPLHAPVPQEQQPWPPQRQYAPPPVTAQQAQPMAPFLPQQTISPVNRGMLSWNQGRPAPFPKADPSIAYNQFNAGKPSHIRPVEWIAHIPEEPAPAPVPNTSVPPPMPAPPPPVAMPQQLDLSRTPTQQSAMTQPQAHLSRQPTQQSAMMRSTEDLASQNSGGNASSGPYSRYSWNGSLPSQLPSISGGSPNASASSINTGSHPGTGSSTSSGIELGQIPTASTINVPGGQQPAQLASQPPQQQGTYTDRYNQNQNRNPRLGPYIQGAQEIGREMQQTIAPIAQVVGQFISKTIHKAFDPPAEPIEPLPNAQPLNSSGSARYFGRHDHNIVTPSAREAEQFQRLQKRPFYDQSAWDQIDQIRAQADRTLDVQPARPGQLTESQAVLMKAREIAAEQFQQTVKNLEDVIDFGDLPRHLGAAALRMHIHEDYRKPGQWADYIWKNLKYRDELFRRAIAVIDVYGQLYREDFQNLGPAGAFPSLGMFGRKTGPKVDYWYNSGSRKAAFEAKMKAQGVLTATFDVVLARFKGCRANGFPKNDSVYYRLKLMKLAHEVLEFYAELYPDPSLDPTPSAYNQPGAVDRLAHRDVAPTTVDDTWGQVKNVIPPVIRDRARIIRNNDTVFTLWSQVHKIIPGKQGRRFPSAPAPNCTPKQQDTEGLLFAQETIDALFNTGIAEDVFGIMFDVLPGTEREQVSFLCAPGNEILQQTLAAWGLIIYRVANQYRGTPTPQRALRRQQAKHCTNRFRVDASDTAMTADNFLESVAFFASTDFGMQSHILERAAALASMETYIRDWQSMRMRVGLDVASVVAAKTFEAACHIEYVAGQIQQQGNPTLYTEKAIPAVMFRLWQRQFQENTAPHQAVAHRYIAENWETYANAYKAKCMPLALKENNGVRAAIKRNTKKVFSAAEIQAMEGATKAAIDRTLTRAVVTQAALGQAGVIDSIIGAAKLGWPGQSGHNQQDPNASSVTQNPMLGLDRGMYDVGMNGRRKNDESLTFRAMFINVMPAPRPGPQVRIVRPGGGH